MVLLCPPGIAKFSVGYKTLYLALFLSFCCSFISQTFIEHFCVPGSALGAGDTEVSGLHLQVAYDPCLAFCSCAVVLS